MPYGGRLWEGRVAPPEKGLYVGTSMRAAAGTWGGGGKADTAAPSAPTRDGDVPVPSPVDGEGACRACGVCGTCLAAASSSAWRNAPPTAASAAATAPPPPPSPTSPAPPSVGNGGDAAGAAPPAAAAVPSTSPPVHRGSRLSAETSRPSATPSLRFHRVQMLTPAASQYASASAADSSRPRAPGTPSTTQPSGMRATHATNASATRRLGKVAYATSEPLV